MRHITTTDLVRLKKRTVTVAGAAAAAAALPFVGRPASSGAVRDRDSYC